MGAALAIRADRTPDELRRHARREPNRRAALRDAVVRSNAEGLAGLYDPPEAGAPATAERGRAGGARRARLRGPDPAKDGVSAWTRADLGRWLDERFGKAFHPASLSRVLRRLELSRQKTRPVHPQADPAAQARFRKGGCATR